MNGHKTIGILGGMGPNASADLYQRMLAYAQKDYGAVQDFDYPPIILYSLPLAGFDEKGISDEELVRVQLVKAVQILESAGCELLVIACNTVHYFYDDLQKSVRIPICNILEETVKRVKKDKYKKVGLFCSDSTQKTHLYRNACLSQEIDIIEPSPSQQMALNDVIEHVMGGNQSADDVAQLLKITQDYENQGAEAVVVGCTEIPLAIQQSDTDMPLIDTTQILAECAVDISMGSDEAGTDGPAHDMYYRI